MSVTTDFRWEYPARRNRLDKVIPGVMDEISEEAAAVASGYAPKRTSALADSITPQPTRKQGRQFVAGIFIDPNAPSGYPDGRRPIEYWYFQERGTADMPGHFYMQRAYDEVIAKQSEGRIARAFFDVFGAR